jgi:hypothetical protein
MELNQPHLLAMAHWLAFSMHRMDDLICLQEQPSLAGYLYIEKNKKHQHLPSTSWFTHHQRKHCGSKPVV